jgi:hypothetical protein
MLPFRETKTLTNIPRRFYEEDPKHLFRRPTVGRGSDGSDPKYSDCSPCVLQYFRLQSEHALHALCSVHVSVYEHHYNVLRMGVQWRLPDVDR